MKTSETLPRPKADLEALADYYSDQDVTELLDSAEWVSQPMVTTSLRLPDNLLARLHSIAEQLGRSYSSIIRDVLTEYVQELSPSTKRSRLRRGSGTHSIHIVPAGAEGWRIVRTGQRRAIAKTDTQSEALDRARAVAKKERVVLVVHRKDGTIRKSVSYTRSKIESRGVV